MMRRIVKSIFGESVRTKRDPHYVGFKAYENTFEENGRRCSCTPRDQKRKADKAAANKRSGLFK